MISIASKKTEGNRKLATTRFHCRTADNNLIEASGVTGNLYYDIQALSIANFDTRFLIPYSRIGRIEVVLGTG